MSNSKNSLAALGPLYRGLPVILLVMFSAIFIAKKYLKYTTPEFESTAKIKLADIHEGVNNSNLFKDFDVFATSNKIGAEVELLKSKVLVSKVIEKLPLKTSIYRVGEIHKTELYDNSPFLVTAIIKNKKWFDGRFSLHLYADSLFKLLSPTGESIEGKLNHLVTNKMADLMISRNEPVLKNRPGLQVNDNYEFSVHSADKLADDLIAGLDVMAVDKDIPVLRISYKCPVAQKSADVVNTLSAAYIADYIEQKYKSADTTEDFLNKQLHTYSKKLSSSENAIQHYRDQHDIINIPQETETDLRKIADLKKQLASVKMNLNAVDSLNDYMKNGKEKFLQLAPNFEAFTDLLSTELVKKAKELQQDRSDLLLRYTPEHEKVKVIDEKLKDISNYMLESIKNTQSNLRIKYRDLDQSIHESEKVFSGLPGREKNMTVLERNFGLNDQVYRFLQGKRTEAEIAKAATISFHRIISAGEVPIKPISPNVSIILILSIILGLMAGIGVVYAVHILKSRVNNEDTINRLTDLPVAAAVPYFKKTIDREYFFKSWVLQMELKGLLKKGTVLLISSFDHLEGKQFIASALSHEFSVLNQDYLFIDASKELASELTRPESWKQYLETLKKEKDIILIKNFPLNDNPSSLLLMATADLNLFILDSRITKKASVSSAHLLHEELRIPNIQFVLNRAGYIPSLFNQIKEMALHILNKKKS
ncbi:exopolysaccharide transport family protein [Pedobacter polysacchareus]|uniref:exopolysaccharide transport family protein n=1 Tax=Pedobacter polysacchareus TaxID=2861973 RepID=UPI001C99781D|nr:GNVR domain-containing protein [Pedobacter polysacchareus]